MPQVSYDYIIAGTGCAGLSLAVHMLQSKQFTAKKILLVDENVKQENDRTWCFWEASPGLFDDIVYKQWQQLWFRSPNFSRELSISPFQYKMIRGIDFYNHCLGLLKQSSAFEFLTGKVESIFSKEQTGIVVDGKTILADYVFSSIQFQKPVLKPKHIWLLQHFKGWLIETPQAAFDDETATLMDFRTTQKHGTAFCYVLPLSPTKALVEFTLFSPTILSDVEYEAELKIYIKEKMGIHTYTVLEKEFGVIPMTNYPFSPGTNRIINLGTAGGQTKGSSGYTFYFIQQHSKAIVRQLAYNGKPFVKKTPARFRFYDSVLLRVLKHNFLPGQQIFTTLFKKNKPQNVLRFLNNASTPKEELTIISSLPTWPFFRAAIKHMIR